MVSTKPDSNIAIDITQSFKDIKFSSPRLKKLVKNTCHLFIAEKLRNAKYQINIAIVNDSQFRRLNSRFLNRKRTSDCLSFDLSDQWSRVFELIVNGEAAKRQGYLRGHSDEAELALYVTHGLLHNFGFDDTTPGKARKMHETEDEILQQNRYGKVYNK